MSKGHTAVHIAGGVVGQNLFEGQEVLLGYLFLPDTGREPLRKMCRTFQTSAHAFSCRWPRSFLPYSDSFRSQRPARAARNINWQNDAMHVRPGTRMLLLTHCQFFKVP